MSNTHPVIAITGSSGAGTTAVRRTFEQIFRRESVSAAYIEGDAFHRYDREQMGIKIAEDRDSGNSSFSHFGPEANSFDELEPLFKQYAELGTGRCRKYLHEEADARLYDQPPGTFTPWEPFAENTDLLFYEGLHGVVKTETVDVCQHVDLSIGVVPVINLEWVQKLHRDRSSRGYSTEAVADTILRRMPDYINYIVPQFSRTDVNFQRVPLVDTSNPFTARHIPTPDESMVVIRFAEPRGIDFAYLRSMLEGSSMSRANTIVCPGGKMDLAMQLIFTPMIWRLIERREKALRSDGLSR
jgi:phosphoribulokinase